MENQRQNKALSIINYLTKQVLIPVAIVFFLYSTGLISAISSEVREAAFSIGLNNFNNEVNSTPKADFDYNFSIKTLDDEVIPMDSFRNKVLFVNLWATWCGPCRLEMPGIQSLYSGMEYDSVKFILLSLDNPGNESKVVRYVRSQRFTFPVFTPSGSLPEQLKVPNIPTTFVVNKAGKIVSKKVGATNFDTTKFKKLLEELANE